MTIGLLFQLRKKLLPFIPSVSFAGRFQEKSKFLKRAFQEIQEKKVLIYKFIIYHCIYNLITKKNLILKKTIKKCRKFYKKEISLPIYPTLTKNNVFKVINELLSLK